MHVLVMFVLGCFNSSWRFAEGLSGSNTSDQLQHVVPEHHGRSRTLPLCKCLEEKGLKGQLAAAGKQEFPNMGFCRREDSIL